MPMAIYTYMYIWIYVPGRSGGSDRRIRIDFSEMEGFGEEGEGQKTTMKACRLHLEGL